MRKRKAFVLMLLFMLLSCERPTTVRLLADADRLTFDVGGDGTISQLTVYGPHQFDQASSPDDKRFIIWRIEAVGADAHPRRHTKTVQYGMLPEGFKQLIPTEGHSPEPLVSGNRYMLRIETLNAVGFGKWFEVKGRGADFIDLKGPCFRDEYGRWTRVECTK